MSDYKRRVTPNAELPRLAGKVEKKLAPADEASAKGYDALELVGEEMQRLTEAITVGAVSAELEMTDSLVHILTGQDSTKA